MKHIKQQTGVTIIELMIALAVIGVIASIAMPSFSAFVEKNRLISQTNDLVTSFHIARSEAIKRRMTISITATNNNWSNGWSVWANAQELNRVDALQGGSQITSAKTTFEYLPTGFMSSGGTLNVCKTAGKPGKQITISINGRVSSSNITC